MTSSNSAKPFILFRVLGNDLPPRHTKGQTLRNLRFILEHEPELIGCEKRWVLNRIVDPALEREIIELLMEAGLSFLHIPFSYDEYASLPKKEPCGRSRLWTSGRRRSRLQLHARRARLAYATNVNGARNEAIQDGHRSAEWVLPWDGNCYVTAAAWNQILVATARSTAHYLVVPMARMARNADALSGSTPPLAGEEPQLGFRRTSTARFSPTQNYGRRDKVELLWRLGVAGPWDEWSDDPWDPPRPKTAPGGPNYIRAGWVARLSSGRSDLEESNVLAAKARASERNRAALAFLDTLDARITRDDLPH